MGALEWGLELGLVALLGATLFHALRLERALGVLKRDRAALEALVAGFNASTRQAEAGVAQLREAADDAGRRIARQIESAVALKDDLGFLVGRAGQAADRLDAAVRAARPAGGSSPAAMPFGDPPVGPVSSGYGFAGHLPAGLIPSGRAMAGDGIETDTTGAPAPAPRLRSQAERDLMQALRLAR
ncbi:DUF6468 domain-containing protein [Acidisphaera rubrifaciens]|uniref:DUF6468 domain-containing protein n=1 Tax=Acidisphaera rubrifaciens HS-AP3 TaxID=1231350 RepID=A0A0D6P7F3_9PROT|nr:DUF6468 domain-containing protein [Acidisphaera rubrifaciens]GAN77685.1 hypothetical protein Asru_0421_02 [Acidisphaera rubrifaciens HS-AP3]